MRFTSLGLSLLLLLGVGCGDDGGTDDAGVSDASAPVDAGARDGGSTDAGTQDAGGVDANLPVPLDDLPPPGNPNDEATCEIPADGAPRDTASPDHVIGDGTPESCTSAAVVNTIALGGVITFNCGPDPILIELDETARIYNDTASSEDPEIVIDGGGLVTLSGRGERRILYMNTCDSELHWTTPNCQDQDHPQLTLQNLTFVDGYDATPDGEEVAGGGAVWSRGGRLRIVNSRFFRNRIVEVGPDVAGAAVRAFSQFESRPIYVVNSTFGGTEELGNRGSNGGGIGSILVSWTLINSLFSYNVATGNGANPAQEGTPGGGSGGAVYNDGATMTLTLCGTRMEYNEVNAHGSAIFFVSNSHTGTINIDRSVITNNTGGSWYEIAPQISGHADTAYTETNSTVE